MNADRFSVQLRQHLLDTANEHPADGQLAAVDAAVARTAQRRTLMPRLAWVPEGAWGARSPAFRTGLVILALLAATIAAALLVGSGPSGSTVFEGTWRATDPSDDSTLYYVIGGGGAPTVRYVDDHASGAVCEADAVRVFTAVGTGRIAGHRLDTEWPDGGGCGTVNSPMRNGSLTYDDATETLLDGLGVTWARAHSAIVVPTRAPLQAPTPTGPRSTALAPGSSRFTSTIHAISIDHPAEWRVRRATEPWTGEALTFDSPAADVFFDPAQGDWYLAIASYSFGDLTAEEWKQRVLGWTCPGSPPYGAFWSWHVDGFRSEQFASRDGGCESGTIVSTETRGYLLRVVASNGVQGLYGGDPWELLKPLLETVDLRPEDAEAR